MKITERRENNVFLFDNGAMVCIGNENCHIGLWDYRSDAEDEEPSFSGSLWFDGDVLEEYDGCYELPEEVVIALKELGYKVEV